MKKSRLLALLLALAMMIGLLAGCADNAEKTPVSSDPGTPTTQPSGDKDQTLEVKDDSGIEVSTVDWFRGPITIYQSTEGAATKKTPEGTLVYANSSQIKAADPNTFQNEFNWSHQIYDCLIERDMSGNGYVPGLATEWGYDENGNFNITLREGVKFHDGTTLNADDVLFTIGRIAKSYVNKSAGAMKKVDLEKSYKTDDLHLTLVFKEPVGSLLDELATGYCGIMSKEYFDANPDATLLDSDAGSGAYMLVETVDGISQTLKAFDEYWGGAPEVDTVIYKLYKDYSVMAIDFMNGDLDMCFNNTYNTVSEFLNGEIPGATLYQVPSRSLYMDLTTRGEVTLADVRLRQALAHCIDYAGLVTAVYQSDTMGSTTTGPFPTGTKYEIDLGVIEYDVAQSQALLKECGYSTSNPCKLKLLSTNSPAGQAAAVIIQQFGALVGFDIDVTILDSAGANEITGKTDVPAEYDLYVCTNSFNTGSPEAFLGDREMYSNPEGASAMSGIDDAAFNELAQKAANSTDEEERATLYAEMQEMFYENLWTIQLCTANSMVLAHSYVGDMEFVSGYHPKFATLTIEG